MEKDAVFDEFKGLCAAEGLLGEDFTPEGDDVGTGIQDDGTLLWVPLTRRIEE